MAQPFVTEKTASGLVGELLRPTTVNDSVAGREWETGMDEHDFRAMAERCRELQRIALRDDVRQQLRQWAEDFDAEADALEQVGSGVFRIKLNTPARN